MTTYIAAYDTESEPCLKALPRIVALHEKYDMPATFFLTAELLDGAGASEIKALLGANPRFEIACHSYTHAILRQVRLSPPPVPAAQFEGEILDSKRRIEDCFARPVEGFRMPWGSSLAMRGMRDLLALVDRGGYRYSSSLLWGPEDTMPALVRAPFTYADDGYPRLWEIPVGGWHDNVLKFRMAWGMKPLQLFPHPVPEANLSDVVQTPAEEFRVHRVFLDRAASEGVGHASLIWHPWSMHRADPDMKSIEMIFQYVRDRRWPSGTFADYARTL